MGESWIAIASFPILSVILAGCGDRLRRTLGLAPGPLLERGSLGFVLGAGVVTLAGFALAAMHAFWGWGVLALAGAMGLSALPSLRDLWGAWRALDVRPALWPSGSLDRCLTGAIAVFLGTGFLLALAPATGMDAGIYHFTIPKLIVQNHGLLPRDDVWIHKSGGFYIVYAFGMALGGETLAKLLGFAMAVAGVCLAAAVAERLRGGTGRIAVFLVLSTPLAAGYLGYEYLELPILAYVAGATLAILRGPEAKAWTFVACLLAGLAVSAKTSAFAVALVVPAALGALLTRDRGRALPVALVSLAAFAAASGFWLLWNYESTGFIIRHYTWSSGASAQVGTAPPLWRGLVRLGGDLATTGLYWTDSVGPFLVAGVAGFLGFTWKIERRVAVLLLLGSIAVYVGGLGVLSRQQLFSEFGPRYLAPCLIGFGAPAAAQFTGWALERPGYFRRAIVAALVVPAVPLLVLKAGKAAVAAPAAVGIESRSSYLEKKVETFAACEVLNRLPSPRVKVLFVALRPYYLDRPYIWIPYVGGVPFLQGVHTREDFLRRVRERGITHVLYEPSPSRDPWFADPDTLFGPPFREIGRWPWKEHESVRLYELESP